MRHGLETCSSTASRSRCCAGRWRNAAGCYLDLAVHPIDGYRYDYQHRLTLRRLTLHRLTLRRLTLRRSSLRAPVFVISGRPARPVGVAH